MEKAKSVDEYIENAPRDFVEKLKQIRGVIRTVAPNSEEKISYGMPYYGYKGRLVYFSVHKNHIGLYIPPPVIEEHKKDLLKYKTSKSAIQFPFDEKLPLGLIKKLIISRMKKNEK